MDYVKHQGLRMGRAVIRFASSSLVMHSRSGSHFSVLPVSIAMLAKWHMVAVRFPTSAWATGCVRVLTASRKFS